MMAQEAYEEDLNRICCDCRDIDVKRLLLERAYSGPIRLGGFQEILRKTDCALCRLLIRALSSNSRDYWQRGHYPIEMCYLGRIEGTSSPSRLEVWFHATSSSLPQGISGHITTVGEILPLETFPVEKGTMQGGRARPIKTSEVEFSVIRSWIDRCRRYHGPNCHPVPQRMIQIMLIDVKRMRIVSCDSSQRYITLSYVWGEIKAFRTTKSNLSELEKDDSLLRLEDQLPRVIRDAIALVSSLGGRFLWIDSLCIIQDDAANKRIQISQMDEVYSQAELTIVALSGKDANARLPGVIKGSRQVQQVSETVCGIRFVAKLPELSSALSQSRWNTRSWTFQEKVLSKRCLFFSDSQIYFQCRSGYYTEDSIREQNRHSPGPGYSNPFARQVTESDDTYSSRFYIYESLVKDYSGRKLSFHADSLNAFAGILSSFKRSFGWQFISSLPENAFDLALLWKPMTSIALRPRAAQGLTCTSPTWCWTSWIGNIFWDPWRMHSYAGTTISLRTEIEQFIIANGDGFRRIRRDQEHLYHKKAYEDFISEIREYLVKNDSSPSDCARETETISDMRLFFKASATKLSYFSISSNKEPTNGIDHPISGLLQRHYAIDTWIYDVEGRHCGTLHGLDPTWICSYDPSLCEFIMLSRCGQEEVKSANIDMYQDALPPEHPSSKDYYEQIFDTNHYRYTQWWALNVMLVEWTGTFARRVAIGQIHSDAWKRMPSPVKLVALA